LCNDTQVPSRAKRVTLGDVAAEAGVSVMTASYAYNKPERVSAESRERVRAAARRLRYAGPDPRARSLRQGRTWTLGVVLGEHLTYAFDDPQAVVFLAGIADVCAGRGYGVTILPITGERRDAERIQQAAVDGFVVWTTSDDDPVLRAIRAGGRPAVVHGGPAVRGFGFVGMDDAAAAEAVGALAFAGAARPAVISFPLDRRRAAMTVTGDAIGPVGFPITRGRLVGFRRAAENAGFDWGEVTVAVCSRNDRHETEEVARALLTGRHRPDAIAAMGDQQAAAVLRTADSLGIPVPAKLAVTGWDDAAVAADLGITTVRQSLRDQGAECARQLLDDDLKRVLAPWAPVPRRTHRRPRSRANQRPAQRTARR
jgi:DNA-binding LacI/PurR family transcriptional regulator